MYNFTTAGESTYEIILTREAITFTHVTTTGELISIRGDVTSGHSATLRGKLVPAEYVGDRVKRPLRNKRDNSFVSCSKDQKSALITAASNAQTYADQAYNYLTNLSHPTRCATRSVNSIEWSNISKRSRYTTWFGAYTSSRQSTVQTHYKNIRNGQLTTDSFDCSCIEAVTFAYVNPDTFGYIYLCDAFWDALATGTDSQAGTLIHESSHFTANGGTQ